MPDEALNALALFETQAARTPDSVAVIADAGRLTYRELDTAASRVAARLGAIGAPAVVGVSAEPRLGLLPALLGVWKSGAAWVPVDPGHPVDLMAHMLRDSGARHVLAGRAGRFPRDVLLLRDVPGAGGAGGEPVPGSPGEVAYVMYTSAPTGRHRGVVIEHRSLAAYLTWAADAYPGLAGRPVVPSMMCSDLTVAGLLGPLVVGGSVRLTPLTGDLPAAAPPGASNGRTAPRTDAERLVTGVFSDLLGIGELGVGDDFFARGGDSLTAVRAIARVRTLFGVDIPLRAVSTFTTAAALAAEVERLVMAELDDLTGRDAGRLLREGSA